MAAAPAVGICDGPGQLHPSTVQHRRERDPLRESDRNRKASSHLLKQRSEKRKLAAESRGIVHRYCPGSRKGNGSFESAASFEVGALRCEFTPVARRRFRAQDRRGWKCARRSVRVTPPTACYGRHAGGADAQFHSGGRGSGAPTSVTGRLESAKNGKYLYRRSIAGAFRNLRRRGRQEAGHRVLLDPHADADARFDEPGPLDQPEADLE